MESWVWVACLLPSESLGTEAVLEGGMHDHMSQNIKNLKHSLHLYSGSSLDVGIEKDYKDVKDSMRPRAGSDSTRNPVSKVIDLIRYRSCSAISSEDKKKSKAIIQHQSQHAAQSTLRRGSLDPLTRRLSLGTTITPHRASDACLDPVHAAILFRDARGYENG
ncbi:uncharacterized protein LOC111642854 [Copidosoma floridanum]|uniref:uncharacterized protein LOC111642854 n=1 Tax=Copidosoma floridanum TaxID=29053 RepID=UPI000C6F72D6|nr:uncharacterized protein LOC111642854 [Copidosoma floridanum]